MNARVARLLALVAWVTATACGGGGGGGGGSSSGGGISSGGSSSGGSSSGGSSSGGSSSGGAGARTLSGNVTYDFVPSVYVPGSGGTLDFAHAAQKPVRDAVVQVMKGTTVLAASSTDAAGHYALSFTESGVGALAVVVLAKTAAMPVIAVQDNTDGNAIWIVGAALDATQTTRDLHATHGWTGSALAYDTAARDAAPFAILDSMYTAAKAFIAVRPSVVFPELHVNWSPKNAPSPTTAACPKTQGCIGTSHFSPSENQIYVLGKAQQDTDEFDTHVIVHEWAHYFEHNLSRSDSPGGPHGSGDVLDPRLAFGEGYGNALAAMLLPESIYSDTLYRNGAYVAGGFDAETEPAPSATSGTHPADDPNPSAFSETSVMRFLYDLFDGGTSEAFDGVALGLGPIYDVLVGPERTTQALTTIGSFIAGQKAQAPVDAAAVDTLAAHYNIGAITDAFGAGDFNLTAMYVDVTTLPSCGTDCFQDGGLSLGGGFDYNKWEQNQYYVFTGAGAQVTVSAASSQDVALVVYQAGQQVAGADANTSGTETVHVNATSGTVYVANVVGFGATSGNYPVTVRFTSP